MVKYLQDLMAEIDAVDLELVEEPDCELQHNDQALGDLPEDLKKLYGLKTRLRTEYDAARTQAVKEVKEIDSNKKREKAIAVWDNKLTLMSIKRDAVDKLFWTAVRHLFPDHAGAELIGLRSGWKVVTTDASCDCARCQTRKLMDSLTKSIALRAITEEL